jgi:hypothetical protein
MTITNLPAWTGNAPNIGQTQSEFNDNTAAKLLFDKEIYGDGQKLNTFINESNVMASEIQSNATLAENSSTIAQSAANYKGGWASLSGALDINSGVFHSGEMWALLVALVDVTASEPSEVNPDWLLLPNASVQKQNTADIATLSTRVYNDGDDVVLADKIKTPDLTKSMDVSDIYAWMNSEWHDVKAMRSAGVPYTNTNSYPIRVSISAYASIGNPLSANLTVGALAIASVVLDLASNYNQLVQLTAEVPAGSTYTFNVSSPTTFNFWVEKY